MISFYGKHHSIHILKPEEWPTTQHQYRICWDMFSRSAQVWNDFVCRKTCMPTHVWSLKIAKNMLFCSDAHHVKRQIMVLSIFLTVARIARITHPPAVHDSHIPIFWHRHLNLAVNSSLLSCTSMKIIILWLCWLFLISKQVYPADPLVASTVPRHISHGQYEVAWGDTWNSKVRTWL